MVQTAAASRLGVCAPHRSYDMLVGQQAGREKFAKGATRITGR